MLSPSGLPLGIVPPTLPTFPKLSFVIDVPRGTLVRCVGEATERAARFWKRIQGPLLMHEQILREISDFCRREGFAESTFGRRAVNDGKLASRLRNGGRITTDTLDRIRAFMAQASGEPPGRRR